MSEAARWTRGDPIVVFGDDWGRSVSTMQHLFRHIALEYPIIWVNAIGHRAPTLSLTDVRRAVEKARGMMKPRPVRAGSGLTGGGVPRFIIEPKGVLPWHGFGPIHRSNTRILRRAILQRLADLGLDRPFVLVTGTPPSAGVVGTLGEAASVYFCMDDFLHFPGVSAKMIAPLEKRLLEGVDGLVATAKDLTRSKFPRSGKTWHLPQGVNYAHFSTPQAEPEDLKAIPHPRIGFAGSVGGYCDLELVRKVALARPDCQVVLVGMITASELQIAALRAPNVHVMDARTYANLPAYVQHFDVGIVPYMKNATTLAVDPLKLLEYLAAGLPVVSTAIPEARKYAATVAIAEDDDEFVRMVGEALRKDRAAARAAGQAVARENTWERRAATLIEVLENLSAS